MYFNSFLANVSILYPLKAPGNQGFPDVSRGYKMGTLSRNVLIFLVKVSRIFSPKSLWWQKFQNFNESSRLRNTYVEYLLKK